MKKFIVIIISLVLTTNLFSQTVAEPCSAYSWGDQKDNFNTSISYTFKGFFSDALDDYNIDTLNCEKLKYDDFFDNYSGNNVLSKHRYIFVRIYKQNGIVKRSGYQNFEGNLNGVKTKMAIIYSKGKKSDYESLVIYSID